MFCPKWGNQFGEDQKVIGRSMETLKSDSITKIIFFILAVTAFFLLPITACEKNELLSPEIESSVAPTAILENRDAQLELLAELKAIEIFEEIRASINAGKTVSGGKALEDLALKYPNNTTISTYYKFDSAIFWLERADEKNGSDEYFKRFEENISFIDINFSGDHCEFIREYIETNLGTDRYNEIYDLTVNTQKHFDSLSDEEKIDILAYLYTKENEYGDDITEAESEAVWQEVCKKYDISENHILTIMSDAELIKSASERASNYK